MELLTVKQIKEFASERSIKIPSGLKKAEMVAYVNGVLIERSNGVSSTGSKITQLLVSHLTPKYCETNIHWKQHLINFGWTVVPIQGWKSDFTDMFLQWFETCSPVFNKNDPSTWLAKNMPTMYHGILKNYFGHTELQWQIRELCVPIFSALWQCDPKDLLCSFDGGCFLPTVHTSSKKKDPSFKQWIHTDQSRDTIGFCSVQGIVNFEDNHFEDGGLVLLEGSNLKHEDYMKKHPSEGITWGYADISDSLFSSCNPIKVCAPAGSIILFDSRNFHCNIQPFGTPFKSDGNPRFRMCTYVSMQPRSGATPEVLAKRISIYNKGRMTSHWCYGTWFKENPEHPHSYGTPSLQPQYIEKAQLNELRSSLIGF